MRGSSLFQREELAESSEFALAERRDLDPRVAIANRSAQGHEDHLDKRIVVAAIHTRIGNFFKVFANVIDESSGYRCSSLASKPEIDRPRSEAFPSC